MPTPSVAFNLTCAFNPGSAKLLFNVEEHGVFRVTREKCISNMRSKSEPVFFFCFFFIQCTVKEQSNTTAKRSETNMLFWHICHLRGLGRHLPQAVMMCVCLCECDDVINCMSRVSVCIFNASYMQISSIWLYIGKHAGWYDIYVPYMCPSMCDFMGSVRCYCAWSVCGWQVFADLSGPVRFPRRPEALVESEPGLYRAWLKDAPLISLVRESVNSLPNYFLGASQPTALCYHVTMWPSEQTNQ